MHVKKMIDLINAKKSPRTREKVMHEVIWQH